jgi:hypothetical protein
MLSLQRICIILYFVKSGALEKAENAGGNSAQIDLRTFGYNLRIFVK